MLGNGIKQSTLTTGTGDLTLVAATGYPQVSDAFAIGQLVAYSIYDTSVVASGLPVEQGVGYLSSSTVFVRARPTATFVSGVYSASIPTPVSLAGAGMVLICTPDAATLESMLPTVDAQSSGINRFITSCHKGLVTAPQSAAALRCYYVPFLLRTGAPIAGLTCSITTAGASGAQALMGMYSCNEKGYIGNKLVDSGAVNIDVTGAINSTLSTPIFLPAGWYFTAFTPSATCSLTCYTSSLANQIGGSPFGFSGLTQIEYRFETLASFALPSTASLTTTAQNVGSSHSPLIYLRLA